MREIKPYRTRTGLARAIDNGGRFYNLYSQAEDQVVSRGELAKAAGTFCTGINAFLFLDMASQDLSPDERTDIELMLEPELRRSFRRLRPNHFAPSTLDSQGVAGRAAIVSGHPRFVENKTEFSGHIMIPIIVGSVTTFTMIPIFDQFDVYELFDDKAMKKPSSLIARSRGARLEHDGLVRFGGLLRKLEYKKDAEREHKYYLETLYYTRMR